MARPTLKIRPVEYTPAWTGVFEAWSKAFVSKNYWRVRSVLPTREDALQECALVWSRCAARYTGTVDNPAWFMSLYTIAVARHWHTLSTQDTECPERYRKELPANSTSEHEVLFAGQAEQPVGLLAAQLSYASAELSQLFSLLANAPQEVLDIVLADGDDSIVNRRICRWLHFTSGTDVLAELRHLLGA